ncbi:MAG: AAA family ATPase [Alphaproteobacteria bacterium]|nr:AAA family ATPase [Alphaproteobacteria bacterium]
MTDLAQWLTKIGLGQHHLVFTENSIDKDLLPELSESDLKELGLNIGERRRLLRAIRESGEANETEVADVTVENDSNSPIAVSAEADRRQLTVLFCDMVGSTALSTTLDAETYRALIRNYQDACANVIQEYGGFVAKYMGDGLDAYFGYPVGHENDAERAVLAGLDIIEAVKIIDRATADASVSVRVGIATGPVVIGDIIGESSSQEASVAGDMPNLAARLQEIADPNCVVIEAGTHNLVQNLFVFADMGSRALKGFPEHIRVRSVESAKRAKTRFDATHSEQLMSFIGRDDELSLLERRWEQTKGGDGQIVLIAGEAGIGKSRLVSEFQQRMMSEDYTPLHWQCSPIHTTSPLYPLMEGIERIAGFGIRDTDIDKIQKLESWLKIGGAELQEALPIYASFLSLPLTDDYQDPGWSPDEQREKLLELHATRFTSLSSNRPVLFLIEDAHWIDPTSLELLERQITHVPDIPILVLITYRPEFDAPWNGRPRVTTLMLNRLDRKNAAVMLNAVADGDRLSAKTSEEIIEKTDGIPLFIEEMTKSALEALSDSEADEDGIISASFVPATLQDSLEARLDRLGDARQIAQAGAVIGPEFSIRLVARILDVAEEEARALAEPLSHSDLFSQRNLGSDLIYSFKHALVRDACYNSILRTPKQQLHKNTADLFCNDSPEIAANEPELIARHYTDAGSIELAIDYWCRAARRSASQSAYAEALSQLENARTLTSQLPESTERDELELDILIGSFGAIMAEFSMLSVELDEAHARALSICERLGDTDKTLPILHARYNYNQAIGRPAVAYTFATRYLNLARTGDDSTTHMIGERASGAALWHIGSLSKALSHVETALNIYETERHHALVSQYGYDIKTTALMNKTVLLGSMGYPERAGRVQEEAFEFTRSLEHPASLAFLIGHLGLTEHFISRDAGSAEKIAGELARLGDSFKGSVWQLIAELHIGRALFESGNRLEGIEMMRGALGNPESKLVRFAEPAHQVLLADSLVSLGEQELALEYLDSAQRETDIGEDRWSEAEIWRVRGDALLGNAGADEAEASYRKSIELARGQEAKMFEIRTATALARMWTEQNRQADATELLEPIYNWFTEGFDTPDLIEAKGLLDELA